MYYVEINNLTTMNKTKGYYLPSTLGDETAFSGLPLEGILEIISVPRASLAIGST